MSRHHHPLVRPLIPLIQLLVVIGFLGYHLIRQWLVGIAMMLAVIIPLWVVYELASMT